MGYIRDYLEMNEVLKITKMNLPTKTEDFDLIWNDKFSSGHDLYSRIIRTGKSRKEAIAIILKGISAAASQLKSNDGMYIIDFKKSEFYLTVYLEKDLRTLVIKTILDYSMKLRPSDRKLSINEAEELLDIDLSEFYKDGFINGYFGSLLIEENVPRTELDVFIDLILEVQF